MMFTILVDWILFKLVGTTQVNCYLPTNDVIIVVDYFVFKTMVVFTEYLIMIVGCVRGYDKDCT